MMPELPEVETYKRYIERTSMERIITKAEVKNPVIVRPLKGKDIVATVTGSEFLSARRHGKQLFLELSRGKWLTWHFGMTGEPVFFEQLSDEPPYDRFLFTFEHGYLGFEDPRMLGRIGVVGSPEEFIRRKRLGPDALSIRESEFVDKFGKAKGAAKSALMDQHKLAGVGNIYSDEILFQCRMDPRTDLSSVEEPDLRCLHKAMRKVLLKSVEVGTDFKKLPKTYLLHYRKKGSVCPKCGGTMETLTLNGRTSYFCPACQRRP
jgi:formamidopyrimidine-DNA glycosylase